MEITQKVQDRKELQVSWISSKMSYELDGFGEDNPTEE